MLQVTMNQFLAYHCGLNKGGDGHIHSISRGGAGKMIACQSSEGYILESYHKTSKDFPLLGTPFLFLSLHDQPLSWSHRLHN